MDSLIQCTNQLFVFREQFVVGFEEGLFLIYIYISTVSQHIQMKFSSIEREKIGGSINRISIHFTPLDSSCSSNQTAFRIISTGTHPHFVSLRSHIHTIFKTIQKKNIPIHSADPEELNLNRVNRKNAKS